MFMGGKSYLSGSRAAANKFVGWSRRGYSIIARASMRYAIFLCLLAGLG